MLGVSVLNSSVQQNDKMEIVKEFAFHIENVKLTFISTGGPDIVHGETKKKYDQLHFHSYYEIFYVNSDSFIIKFEDGVKEFSKNDLIIISPGTKHKSVTLNPSSARYNMNFHMEKIFIKSNFSLYDALVGALSEPCTCIKNFYSIREVLKKVVVDLMQEDEMLLSLHSHELLVEILKKNDAPQIHPAADVNISDSNMIRIYKLQQIIFDTYSQEISLSSIAEQLFLSTRQASRIIKQYYGCTYRELVADLRMKVAVDMLTNTNLTVLEIATQIGYNSIKGFYTYFKKKYNCLPTEYRKKVKDSQNKQKNRKEEE